MANKCILDERKKNGCATCDALCANRIAMEGLNGDGGRIGAAGAPSDYKHLTLANSPARETQKKIYDVLDVYATTLSRQIGGDAPRIKSLYFFSSSPGTGKTTTAVALMNEFIMSNYLSSLKRGEVPAQMPAMFFDLNATQRTYNLASQSDDKERIKQIAQKFDKAAKVPFLVLDDVAVRSASDAWRSMVHDVINYRTANSLATIYTSNLTMEEFVRVYDERLYDRVRDNCKSFGFEGESNRKGK